MREIISHLLKLILTKTLTFLHNSLIIIDLRNQRTKSNTMSQGTNLRR